MRTGPSLPFCGIAVMAKASQPGQTKTRLSPPLTFEEAARFNTAFLKDIAQNLLDCAQRADMSGYMAYGPAGSHEFFERHLPSDIGLIEACHPCFGDCLVRALIEQLAAGHGAACVLNSDSPTLPVELLTQTVDLLKMPGDCVVLGPSTDGGYYLLGCKRVHRHLFEAIAWSTETVTQQTLARAAEIGVKVHLLPEWYDVDDGAALCMLADELINGRSFHSHLASSPAPHSAALLKQLLAETDFERRMRAFSKGRREVPGLKEAAA